MRFLRRLFGLARRRPLCPWVAEMRAKDPVFYAEVGPMPVMAGLARWREKYPEDFAE